MKKRIAKSKEKILIFKVTPCGESSITRELALAENQTLYNLAEAIVDSFDFDFDHCFGFFNSFEKWFRAERVYELFKDVGEEGSPNARGVKKVTIAETFSLDKKLLFLFDYGDEWKFTVELMGKEEPVYNRKYPFLISKTGKSPEQYPVSDEML
jgi:hypothetical protein